MKLEAPKVFERLNIYSKVCAPSVSGLVVTPYINC